MDRSELFRDFQDQFTRRKFVGGLLVAFIDLLDNLSVDAIGLTSFSDFLVQFPRHAKTAGGKTANTLIVATRGGTKSLRPFYNAAERYFRTEHKRFDYPSCAPHATQAWNDYLPWLDSLLAMGEADRGLLRTEVVDYVLEVLPSHEFDPSSIDVDPPLFRLVLRKFDMAAHEGEKSGAAFQGIVFGFIRADNPHLQVEIDKVRTGSKRLQRVGDVDAWEGGRLAITAEVKQYVINSEALPDLAAFANEASKRGAIAIVAAIDFGEGVRQELEKLNAETVSQSDMLRIVTLWDPVKQRTAVSSFVFYAKHIEKNAALSARLDLFLKQAEIDWRTEREAKNTGETDDHT